MPDNRNKKIKPLVEGKTKGNIKINVQSTNQAPPPKPLSAAKAQ